MAGGAGTRFGGRKQFVTLGGREVAAMSVEPAREVSDGVVVVLPEDTPDSVLDASTWPADSAVRGGPTRAASVRAGLRAVPASAEIVVVHDAARPLASTRLFAAVIAEVASGAEAAVPGLAVTDTLKRTDGKVVVSTLPRDGIVAVQTPQAFRAALLRSAHAAAGDATDDASLVEMLGATVRVVPGEATNVKLTEPGDLPVLEALLAGIRAGTGER